MVSGHVKERYIFQNQTQKGTVLPLKTGWPTCSRLTNMTVSQDFPRHWKFCISGISPILVNGFNTVGHLMLTWNKQKRKCHQQSSCFWLATDTPVYFQKWGKSRTSWWWTGKLGMLHAVHGVTKSWTWLSDWTELLTSLIAVTLF